MQTPSLNRRRFIQRTTLAGCGGLLALTPGLGANSDSEYWDPQRPFPRIGRKLVVQAVLMVQLPTRREEASWKSWGGVQSESAVVEEMERIRQELQQLESGAEFGLEFLPLARVSSITEAEGLAEGSQDVTLVYACTGSGSLLAACLKARSDKVIFVCHRSGPVYY